MGKTQKNKATAKHLGLLKAKLAKLKAELVSGGVSLLHPRAHARNARDASNG